MQKKRQKFNVRIDRGGDVRLKGIRPTQEAEPGKIKRGEHHSRTETPQGWVWDGLAKKKPMQIKISIKRGKE